ncbi:hypothetical protein V8Q34_14685 [Blautia sp. JLR.GB0024]|uniref:hypothetical protein n=1 Tax=Blautia sp. JLR.GB0024 TaxID=3123295 RepID=UPI00300680FA
MELLLNEILTDLTTELSLTESSDIAILKSKVKNSIREVKRTRNYLSHHTEEFIWKDMERYYSNIRELALYDYNQIGAEGQLSMNENGVSRSWKDRKECLMGIVPFVSGI